MIRDNVADLARELYAGKVDKVGGSIASHAERVAEYVLVLGGNKTMFEAALLHDVIEDTNTTGFDLLSLGVDARTVSVVMALTRRPKEPYFDYIRRVAANPEARVVKLADNLDNASRLRNLEPAEEASLGSRYAKARRILLEAKSGSITKLAAGLR